MGNSYGSIKSADLAIIFSMATLTEKTLSNNRSARGFVELLARSNFSFLQGASHPDEMVEQAIHLDYDGIALCDLNGLYGVARGFQAAHSPSFFTSSLKPKDHFKYLFGTELILTDESSLVLLPMNKSGYSRLCYLLTLGKRQAAKGFSRLSLDDIQKENDDLIAFAIPPITTEHFLALQKIFGDRLYIPVWRDLTWESQQFCEQAFQLEATEQAQLFVTQRAFMHSPERKPLFDVLTCVHHHTTLDDAKDILIQNAERYLRPLQDISWLWQDRMDLMEETLQIASRLQFSLNEIRYRYPQSQLPSGKSARQYMTTLVEQGLQKRYPLQGFPQGPPQKVLKIAHHEIQMIAELEYEDYFLTLYEICEFARAREILFQGRGSAANSIVCFALGITNVDPNEIDLLFERFISKERGEPPDIDIDFEHERREEVLQHIYEKYGETHAAMVCTVIRYKSRMSIREAAKVFGIPLTAINSMIRYMGRDGMRRLLNEPESRTRFGVEENKWFLFLKMATQLNGFPRHLGIHTGGFIITQNPITEMVPVEKASMQGRYVIQWNKDDVALLKLMKIDLLSLGMLTALRKCLKLLKTHKDINLNLAQIPQNDPQTYEMICQADTVGVFQIESRAQMNTLPRLKPKNFYDLVIEIALVRPGPLQGGMVHPYLRRRAGLEKIQYAHPDLKPILEKTMGVPIFQEQVMRIAIVAAGFSPGEADELRRVISSAWRKKVTMDGVHQRIVSGLLRHGLSQEYADQIYQVIEGFSNYGFPESHSASFALLTYASSYIKCHHPDIFTCALLNSQPMGFYAPRTLIADAQRHGVQVLPLDIQFSEIDYSLETAPISQTNHGTTDGLLKLRVGLRSIYGVPQKVFEKIVSERRINGPFQSLTDFVQRTEFSRTILLKLATAGALYSFETNARDLLWKIEALQIDKNSIFWGQAPDKDVEREHLPFESQWDLMQREYQTKGFSIEQHPMSVLRGYLLATNIQLQRNNYVPYFSSDRIKNLKHKSKVRVAGLVGITQRPPTAKGMCFITLEDEFGFINVVVPPDIYQRDRSRIYSKSLLEIHGHLERTGALINIKAEKVLPLLRGPS
jgi:DNA polymerase-3 subunit alpha/error-prone DNA polymerase